MKNRLLVLVLLCINVIALTGSLNAATYYFSTTDGDDSRSSSQAQSSSTPWKTISKLNSVFSTLAAGDQILFKRGDIFYGGITITKSSISFGAYGSGNNPVITGFSDVTSWTSLGGNKWQSSAAVGTLATCNMVTVSGTFVPVSAFPTSGYNTITSSSATSVTASTISGTFTGGYLVTRKQHWIIDRAVITSQSGTTVNFTSPGTGYNPQNGWGYKITNASAAADEQNEWWYDASSKKIGIYSTASPTGVQASTVDVLISAGSYSSLTFTGINFTGSNTNVFTGTSSNNNITFESCGFYNNGTNCFSLQPAMSNITINNCIADRTMNDFIDANGATKVTITNNTITNTALVPGMGKNGDGQYIAIYNIRDNSLVQYNVIKNTGYIGIDFRGGACTVANNLVDGFNMVKDDGSGIYTFTGATAQTFAQRYITNNIVLNGGGAGAGTNTTNSDAFGIYMDDNSSNVTMTGNTIANCGASGIFFHACHDVTATDNTVFNCVTTGGYGQLLLTYPGAVSTLPVRNITFTNNKIISKTASQLIGYLKTSETDLTLWGTWDNNYYCRPLNDASATNTFSVTKGSGASTTNLAGWQSSSKLDANSKKSPMNVSDVSKIRFEYNATKSSVTVNLGATYMDVTGKNYTGSIVLAPYSSAVLIYVSGTVANQPPVANAGSNQTISQPSNSVTLDGSASTDPDGTISTYAWTKVSGPSQGTITNAAGMTTTATNLTQGTYVFKLTVTDNGGATGADSVTITVNGVLNQTPVANAGANQTITLPTSTVTLDGSASSDPDGTIASYAWTKVSGPTSGTITSGSSATTTVTGLAQGTYVFSLTVTDNGNITATDEVTITVNATANKLPVANAGANQTISLPTNSVTLNGSASSDADGTIASYAWTKVSGPTSGTITSATAASTTVTGLAQGTYIFKLTVKDNSGGSAADSVTITVNAAANQAPVANAGANQTITLPTSTVTLNGTGSSDADGTIASYAWTKASGPTSGTITSVTSGTTTVTGLVQGTYVFQLTVKDNAGATATDNVTITVNAAANQSPIANAGANQTITLPTNSVTLNGSASSDPDGTISTYTWSKASGPATGTISNTANATTTATNLVQGVYVFKLTVKDNSNATASDSVIITVNAAPNQAPVANAGANQTITLPTNTVTINGSASSDADGSIASYTWTKVSGPTSGTITSATSATTTVTGLAQGTYVFLLTVKDDDGATATDNVTITVNAAPNQAPVANAGINQTITLPINTVTLDGTASSDADGSIVSYTWTKTAGGTATIANATGSTTSVTNLQAGQYTFQLTVKDDDGATATKTVRVTVLNATDQDPVADAGQAQTITLPVNSVTLNGSGSVDPDGTISTYAWTKISGPMQSTIAAAGSVTTAVNNLVEGVYVFRLTVTDNSGNTATDSVTITVNAAANKAPVANAGVSQTITLPVNTGNLDGSASTDPDGSIATYSWVKISGGAATIANNSIAKTTVTGLSVGQYIFELTVTDDKGATSKAQVKITVNAAANKAPVANAGSNKNITLPVNTTTIDGSASSDPDGTIVSYQWVKISGGAATITDATAATTTITGLVAGQYTFELTVTDNNGATAKAQMKVTVNAAVNKRPVASAGNSQTITLPINTVTLDGSASSDADGNIVSYSWVKISGGAGTITDATAATTTVTGLVTGQYTFEITVTDDKGATSKAQVKITVIAAPNQSPVANAGSNITITLPTDSITLDGSASSDPDGSIASYGWVKISGGSATIKSSNSATTSVSGLSAGQYTFELTITDNKGATSKAQVKVTVNAAANKPPVANAGASQTLPFGTSSVTLDGSKSSDPDGQIANYSWALISGANVTIASGNTAKPVITGLQGGEYIFELTVTDDKGATATAQVKIIVNLSSNQAPVADAGANQNVNFTSNTANTKLDGTKSYDPDGTIVSYNWAKVDGPSSVTITNMNTATPIISGMIAGVYTFELTVTDNRGASTKAQVKITVRQSDNEPPVADAGNDVTATMPNINNKGGASATLDGTKSYDPDGTIYTYSWLKLNGPSAVTIGNINSSVANVSGLQVGQYTFQLTVTDNRGASSTDEITVIVKPSADQLPVADAGDDVTVTAPTSTATLDGSNSSDSQGSLTYKWEQVSGPSTSNISSVTSAKISVTGLAIGQYIFKLTVKNSRGVEASDEVKVNVINGNKSYATMDLYPNPASSVINAKITSDSIGVVVLNIYDMNGRAMKKVELNKQLVDNLRQQVQRRDVNNNPTNTTDVYFTFPINISALGNGVYVLETIIDGKVKIASKFVKY
ncbi:MAG: PKD domain-containing protein [Chitinophagaceae bacterium]